MQIPSYLPPTGPFLEAVTGALTQAFVVRASMEPALLDSPSVTKVETLNRLLNLRQNADDRERDLRLVSFIRIACSSLKEGIPPTIERWMNRPLERESATVRSGLSLYLEKHLGDAASRIPMAVCASLQKFLENPDDEGMKDLLKDELAAASLWRGGFLSQVVVNRHHEDTLNGLLWSPEAIFLSALSLVELPEDEMATLLGLVHPLIAHVSELSVALATPDRDGPTLAWCLEYSLPFTRIRTLSLHGNGLGDEDFRRLAGALGISTVRDLDLSENRLGNAGAMALVELLRDSKITRLNVTGNPDIDAVHLTTLYNNCGPHQELVGT